MPIGVAMPRGAMKEVVEARGEDFAGYQQLEELLEKGCIALVRGRGGYLEHSFVRGGHKIQRRQELSRLEFVPKQTAVRSVRSHGTKGQPSIPISHAWLALDHPDPHAKRRADVACVLAMVGGDKVFMDYLSLHQKGDNDRRTRVENDAFKHALSGMHLVFSNPNWRVCRIVDVGTDAINHVSYDRRGWCSFETNVASVGAMALLTIRNGELDLSASSAVPISEDRFRIEVPAKIFTHGDDRQNVVDMYDRFFPTLEMKQELIVQNWGDVELTRFSRELEHLPNLCRLIINNNYSKKHLSCDVVMHAETLLKRRGGA